MPESVNPLLLVDDDADNRDMLSRRLKRAGYQVEVAVDAQDALRVLGERAIDLVLLDSMMPGMSGVDLLKVLRQTHSAEELPIIMVTAVSESAKIVEALNLGANDYITKPIDFSVALARLGAQLNRKRAEQALRESEQRYSLAARGANDGLWDWDLRANRVYYSPRWKEMLGLGESEVDSSPEAWLSRIHPEDRPRVESELSALWARPGASDFVSEHRVLHKDGAYRWMLIRGHVLRGEAGQAIRMAGSQTDVTANKAFDSLTGLPNRTLLHERIARCLGILAENPSRIFAVLFLDLDRFKVINDSLGHVAGDKLLAALARRLQSVLRGGDSGALLAGNNVIARFGGDEFVALLEDIRQPSHAESVAERIQSKIAAPFDVDGRQVYITASIGIAIGADSGRTPVELLRDADTAMYHAKALGGARWEVFRPGLRQAAIARLEMENDLRRAVERQEFEVYYQPKVLLSDGRLAGFEALLRWKHPSRGLILPRDFIALAEETGLIIPIGLWVLRQACAQMRRWHAEFPSAPPLEISVNLSLRQFRDPELLEKVGTVLRETGIEPSSLQLEITESVLAEDAAYATCVLNELKKLRVGVKLDDFGTGYSSLSYLCRLPCDSLKIDSSFVQSMCDDENSLQIVKAIISLAEDLGKEVTAEGVETGVQAARLRGLGCQYGQGFLFSGPLPPQQVADYLKQCRGGSLAGEAPEPPRQPHAETTAPNMVP